MKAILALLLLAAVNLAADAQYYLAYGHNNDYYDGGELYAPQESYDWQPNYYDLEPYFQPAFPVYQDLAPTYFRQPRGKKGKKGGDDEHGWPQPVVKYVGWGWDKEQHIYLPGPYFQDAHPPTIHIHPHKVHHHEKQDHGWGWGHQKQDHGWGWGHQKKDHGWGWGHQKQDHGWGKSHGHQIHHYGGWGHGGGGGY